MAARLAWASLLVALWVAPLSARSAERTRRVVLMQPSPALERALRTALMPWGMRVARTQQRAHPATPRSPQQARVLAERLHADALVWIAESSRRHELWLYDNTSGALTARGVPAPPFDETRAAALALSVKTELRKGTLADSAPPTSEAAKRVTDAEKATEAPGSAAPEPELQPADAAASGERTELKSTPQPPGELPPPPDAAVDAPRRVVVEPNEPHAAPSLRLLLHGGARLGANSLVAAEGRYGVEGRWAPWASSTSATTWWFGARFDLGLPQTIATRDFRGEYSEIGAGIGASANVHATRWLELGAQLAASVYTASMSGSLPNEPVESTRKYGAALHLRPELDLAFGAVGVLLQPAVGVALARQLYQVERSGIEVMEMSPLWWQLGGAFRVDVD